ncbi:hypothetical protein GCG54_00003848 [Colletotrichum gloeosporioides]|uniref:Zn(2)-C6 fungal-type domain-containing protein n=1 Tax=Colletotrichum gloeosporioides TaxID=474922 RepID=A0A8H4C5U8_COLGL|nr:uncharacterized protein GCG54_00003848 [Colletotrichum gloeosporioides]KAF3797949.1 hypothetical protein GCG54_00003848 [Colletotrichum gloeosporioides]
MKTKQHTVCDECRRRKLGVRARKCDGKQPSCSQCVLSGLGCPGYKKHIVFRQPTSPSSVASGQRKKRPRQNRRPNNTSQKPIPPTRALTWPLSDVLSLCVQNFVPANELGSMSSNSALSQSRICGAWVEVLPGLIGGDGRHDGPLSSAIKALGISLVARGPSGRAPVHEAIAAHSSALKAVGRLIPHANDDPNNYDEISAAIMCLFLSEVCSLGPYFALSTDRRMSQKFFPTSSSAATVHARGIGELIQLRPPQFYASGTPHKLFYGNTVFIFMALSVLISQILHAFDTRKSTFLGAPEWKTEPFRGVVQDPLQTLLSEACAIPAILEMLDRCSDKNGLVPRQAVTQFVEAINRLDRWHKSVNMTVGDFTPLPETSTAGTNFDFPNITVANSLSHYWAFWIICATQIKRLTARRLDISGDCLLIDGERPDSEAVNRKIIQLSTYILACTGYLMREDMKLYGTASAFFPLHIARSALQMFGGSDEAICEQLKKNAEIIYERGYEDVLLLHRSTIIIS